MLLLFGCIVLLITSLISVLRMKKIIQAQTDMICGMQFYICEKTGDVMSEEQMTWYRDYWRR